MKYLSVCSGIEAASVAWHQLGWEPVGFAEIEKFPAQVLAHRFPGVKNYGDMTKYKEWDIEPGTIDLLVGGTPCQAFSVAGLRKGLADPRGNLALVFLGLADHFKPEWIVWENVPGVLSSNGGRDFGAFLGALGQLGYGWAYRTIDAQYSGTCDLHRRGQGWDAVPQRRRRVFVVAHSSGDPRRCASVLFERESLCGDPAPSREAGQKTTADPGASATGGGCWWDGGQVSQTLDAVLEKGQTMPEKNRFPAVLQRSLYESHPNDSRVTGPVEQCPTVSARWGTGGNNTPLVTDGEASAFTYSGYSNQPAWMTGNRTDCLSASGHSDGSHQGIGIVQPGEASAFSWQCRGDMRGMVPRPTAQLQRCQIEAVMVPEPDAICIKGAAIGRKPEAGPQYGEISTGTSYTLNCVDQHGVMTPAMHVRRLTPVECERLQGFPDGWTDIRPNGKDTPDSPRYKALGNSMAVPVMRWIGMRIAQAVQ